MVEVWGGVEGGVGWDGMGCAQGWEVVGWGGPDGVGWGEVRQGGGVEWCGGRLPPQVRLGIGRIHCLGLIWELNRSKLLSFLNFPNFSIFLTFRCSSHLLLIFIGKQLFSSDFNKKTAIVF